MPTHAERDVTLENVVHPKFADALDVRQEDDEEATRDHLRGRRHPMAPDVAAPSDLV